MSRDNPERRDLANGKPLPHVTPRGNTQFTVVQARGAQTTTTTTITTTVAATITAASDATRIAKDTHRRAASLLFADERRLSTMDTEEATNANSVQDGDAQKTVQLKQIRVEDAKTGEQMRLGHEITSTCATRNYHATCRTDYLPLAQLLTAHQYRTLQRIHPDYDWNFHYVAPGTSAWLVPGLDLEVRQTM